MRSLMRKILAGGVSLVLTAALCCTAPVNIYAEDTVPSENTEQEFDPNDLIGNIGIAASVLAGAADCGLEITLIYTKSGENIYDVQEKPVCFYLADIQLYMDGSLLDRTEDGTFIIPVSYTGLENQHTFRAMIGDDCYLEKSFTIEEYLEKITDTSSGTNDAAALQVAKDIQSLNNAISLYQEVKQGSVPEVQLFAEENNAAIARVKAEMNEVVTTNDSILPSVILARTDEMNESVNLALEDAGIEAVRVGHTLSLDGPQIELVEVFQPIQTTSDSPSPEETAEKIRNLVKDDRCTVAVKSNPVGREIIAVEKMISKMFELDPIELHFADHIEYDYASQYVASAIEQMEKDSGNTAAAVNAYAAAAVYDLTVSLNKAVSPAQTYGGMMTWYNDPSVTCANLTDKAQQVIGMGYGAVALTDEDYEKYAGGWIEVTVTELGLTFPALVADLMPKSDNAGKDSGDVDLMKSAFDQLIGTDQGLYPVTWKPIASPISDDVLKVKFKDHSSQWWGAIQIEGYSQPIQSVKYGDTELLRMRDANNYFINFYEMPTGAEFGNSDSYTFTVTDILGNTFKVKADITLTDTELTEITSVEAVIVS